MLMRPGVHMGLGLSLSRGGNALVTPTLTWTSDSATYDPEFSMTEIAEGDEVELQIDDNEDFASLYDSDTNTIDASEALSGSLTFAITTLDYDTTYYARARYTRNGRTSDWSGSVSKAMDPAPDPALPSSGLVAAWEADDLASLFNTITGTGAITTDGDLVGTWNDRSGGGKHLTSSGNTAARPVYKTDGASHWLLGSGAQILRLMTALTGTGLYNSGTGYTFAIALRTTGLPDASNLAPWSEGNSATANSSNSPMVTVSAADDVNMFVRGDDNVLATGSGIVDADAFDGSDTVLILTDNGSGQIICYEDGDTTGTTRNYTRKTITIDQFALFALARTTGAGAAFFKGRIYAAAAWTGLLSQADRATVFTRFGAKQGRSL